ncbi:hypothetical protein CVT24_000956 [Panaeolus cyanescens]|uniref:Uncharacterized protein n=1 Tax=Panaeolus cyanescens TaxID=181874 RepID=A0A409YCJ4_9AGAR|nr:hypothetical protein CVT24_000956 [Panaeolus cyanescens]
MPPTNPSSQSPALILRDPLDVPHYHTGNDGISSMVGCINIKRVESKGDLYHYLVASLLNAPGTSARTPMIGVFYYNGPCTKIDLHKFKKSEVYLVRSSLYRPIWTDKFQLGLKEYPLYGELHWIVRIPVPNICEMEMPYLTVAGICSSSDNMAKVFSIKIGPKMCIHPQDVRLSSEAKEESALTTFTCIFPKEGDRHMFTAPYRDIHPGDCVTVHGFMTRVPFTPTSSADREPFTIVVDCMSVAKAKVPLGLELVAVIQ